MPSECPVTRSGRVRPFLRVQAAGQCGFLSGSGILVQDTLSSGLVDLLDRDADGLGLVFLGVLSLLDMVFSSDLMALLRRVLVAMTFTLFLADLILGMCYTSLHTIRRYFVMITFPPEKRKRFF